MSGFTKRFVFFAIVVILVALFVAYRYTLSSTILPPEKVYVVGSGSVVERIHVTGKVQGAETVELAFEKDGRVARVIGDVGTHVTKGSALIELNHSDLDMSLASARAALASAQAWVGQAEALLSIQKAQLLNIQQGAKPEEIQVTQTQVENATRAIADAKTLLTTVQTKATTDLANLYADVPDVIEHAFVAADTVLNQQAYSLYTHDNPSNPKLIFYTTDSTIQDKLTYEWLDMQKQLSDLQTLTLSIPKENDAIDGVLVRAKKDLNAMVAFLDHLNAALTSAITSASFTSDMLTGFKTSINAARTSLNTTIATLTKHAQSTDAQRLANTTSITNANVAVNTAQNNLVAAQSALILKQSKATDAQIASQKWAVDQAVSVLASANAQVQSARAAVANWQTQIAKTTLIAPFSGVITRQDAKMGAIAGTTPLVTLVSDAKYEVVTFVSEADLGKIQLGQRADITLDAYGVAIVFPAVITKIDPASTIINTIPGYKVTLQFTDNDARLKVGLTANVSILVHEAKNVILVPKNLILDRGSEHFILLSHDTLPSSEVPVTLGVMGDDGKAEITSGLKVGDRALQY